MKKKSALFCIFVLIITSLANINYLAASDRGLKLTVKTPNGNRIDTLNYVKAVRSVK